MTITTTSYTSSLLDSTSTANTTATSETEELQNQFLTLLTAQLQNQDPMDPMDNAELTSQLAQLSAVEGISQLNSTLETLLSGYQSSQTMQAASLIDHVVLAEGDNIELNSGVGAAAFELKEGADKVMVKIQDAYGNEVRSLALGPQESGQVTFGWDGLDNSGKPAADGNYWFVVEAERAGSYVDATPLSLTTVRSVVLSNNTVELDTTSSGTLRLDQVRQIF